MEYYSYPVEEVVGALYEAPSSFYLVQTSWICSAPIPTLSDKLRKRYTEDTTFLKTVSGTVGFKHFYHTK